ncbi:ABC transporter permease [Amnibacterium flavum]|uniref:ABC transporter permease n=1 Tax=Amnibacterium flavum TaxID=2173173 RepID=A0A2V1HKZ5_9MICO|nr:ABC transporter permease [Amnibacterium flavum]PVZ93293.1 ABC transporter permease [Amnibacterium flavum]
MTATTTLTETPEAAEPTRSSRHVIERVRDYGIVAATGLLVVALALLSPVFFTAANIGNLLFQATSVGLIACAGTLLLISGGFDLSVGANFAFSGVVAAMAASVLPAPIALAAGALVGTLIGACNGLLVTVGRINPLVATLASSIVIGGLAFLLTQGRLINVTDEAFRAIGTGRFLGIYLQTFIWIGFAIVCGLILAFTALGRHIYAVGGNAEAARLSGVRVTTVRTAAYALSGLAAGIAGVLSASQVATGQANVGASLALGSVAAIVVGGTSMLGGEGAVWRTVLGVLLLALISNGFNLMQVDPMFQQIVEGVIILLAVGVDAWARRGK